MTKDLSKHGTGQHGHQACRSGTGCAGWWRGGFLSLDANGPGPINLGTVGIGDLLGDDHVGVHAKCAGRLVTASTTSWSGVSSSWASDCGCTVQLLGELSFMENDYSILPLELSMLPRRQLGRLWRSNDSRSRCQWLEWHILLVSTRNQIDWVIVCVTWNI